MVEYSKVDMKFTDTQLKRQKIDVKNNAGTNLRMVFKMFDENDLPHELLLTTRQRTKLRNAFNINMSTDIKLSKAQISKIIQSGRFLGSLLSNLAGPLMKVTVPSIKNILALVRINTVVQQLMQEFKRKYNVLVIFQSLLYKQLL